MGGYERSSRRWVTRPLMAQDHDSRFSSLDLTVPGNSVHKRSKYQCGSSLLLYCRVERGGGVFLHSKLLPF